MSVNKYLPHILVLPEDDANRQMANGFLLGLDPAVHRNIQVLSEVGGWIDVLSRFASDHVAGMRCYPERFMILLIDFDDDASRLNQVKTKIDEPLIERVFILGALSEPEKLKSAGLGSYETIGLKIAQSCRGDGNNVWEHELLRHNQVELNRLGDRVRPILFPEI